jgi:hypothetical protein
MLRSVPRRCGISVEARFGLDVRLVRKDSSAGVKTVCCFVLFDGMIAYLLGYRMVLSVSFSGRYSNFNISSREGLAPKLQGLEPEVTGWRDVQEEA